MFSKSWRHVVYHGMCTSCRFAQGKKSDHLKVGHFWPHGQNRPTWASDISGCKHTNSDVKCLLESPYLPLQNEILHFYVAYI